MLRNRHHWRVAAPSFFGLVAPGSSHPKVWPGQHAVGYRCGRRRCIAHQLARLGFGICSRSFAGGLAADGAWPGRCHHGRMAAHAGLSFWWLGFGVGYLFFSSIDLKEAPQCFLAAIGRLLLCFCCTRWSYPGWAIGRCPCADAAGVCHRGLDRVDTPGVLCARLFPGGGRGGTACTAWQHGHVLGLS